MRIRIIFITVCLLLAGSAVRADEIICTNGERLIGRVVKMEGGKLVFTSESAGEIKVDMRRVQQITTEKPVHVYLKDRSIIKSTGISRKGDATSVIITGAGQQNTIGFSSLAGIYTQPRPRVTWSRSITAGATSSHGNSDSTQANVAIDLLARSEKHRLRIKGIFLYGREENPDADEDPSADEEITTEENFKISAKYDYFFTKKIFGFLSASYEKDHIDDLDYRIITAAGAGRQWWESSVFQLSTDAGISLVKEKYTSRDYHDNADDGNDTVGFSEAGTGTNNLAGHVIRIGKDARPPYTTVVDRKNDLALQLGCHLGWKPSDRLRLLSNVTYNPSIDDFSDYFLAADAEIRAAINKRLFSSLKAIFDYDPTPGEGISSTEIKYILGLGLDF